MLNQIAVWFSKKRFLRASQSGNVFHIRSQIKAVDPETINTALIHAANCGQDDVVKVLLEGGADPQAKDDQEFTAFIWAAYQGYEDVVQVMLDFGIGSNQRTKDGRTALMWAVKAGRIDTVQCFLDSDKADLTAKDGSGFTALMHAVYNGHNEIVKNLMNAGADPNFRANNEETALMWAADRGQSKTVQILLDAGADPKAADNDGKTVLLWAATQKHGRTGYRVRGGGVGAMGNDYLNLDAIKILLEAGTDLNAQDKNGETALNKAKNARYTEIVEILQNADVTN